MDLVFELKQDVAALKEKSSSGTDPEPEPTTKTWTVTVTKTGAEADKTVTYKLTDGGEDQTVSKYTVGSNNFTFEITAAEKPTIFSVDYNGETISSSDITVTEKLDN